MRDKTYALPAPATTVFLAAVTEAILQSHLTPIDNLGKHQLDR